MSKIDPLAKMLGEGVVEMRRRLDAAEGKVAELETKLAVAREAFAEVEEALSTRPIVAGLFYKRPDLEEALLIIQETLVALEVAP